MRVPAVLLSLLLLTACSAPPQKEIDLAQGAIDAARAAGAEQYAAEPFGAATSALQEAQTAVTQGDYRLALSHALNAHERAQEAAREAADNKARARSNADVAIVAASTALERLRTQIEAAETARLPRRELDGPRTLATSAEAVLQEARTEAAAEHYLQAQETVKGLAERITEEITALDAALAKRQVRPGRR